MSEQEFWRKVRTKLRKIDHALLVAVEEVRDEHNIHQNHIAGFQTRIGFTCFDIHGKLPPKLKTLNRLKALIDTHIERVEEAKKLP